MLCDKPTPDGYFCILSNGHKVECVFLNIEKEKAYTEYFNKEVIGLDNIYKSVEEWKASGKSWGVIKKGA